MDETLRFSGCYLDGVYNYELIPIVHTVGSFQLMGDIRKMSTVAERIPHKKRRKITVI
jgi:hypothetical protein